VQQSSKIQLLHWYLQVESATGQVENSGLKIIYVKISLWKTGNPVIFGYA
jgi:hypothetical protein